MINENWLNIRVIQHHSAWRLEIVTFICGCKQAVNKPTGTLGTQYYCDKHIGLLDSDRMYLWRQ